ncbi:hypothetical protein [Saccharothrix deserti]|uniref:hypothetical protein n=1 Tax=Saccharothrix deserti TaxID=2593674 RepID=UPI00131CDB2A|nr:hypothetical protein [Saccharothrix deserti]
MTTHHVTTPTDAIRNALPPETVLLAPTPPAAVPMRPPAGAWGLVVVAVNTIDAAGASVRLVGDGPRPDPAHTDTAALLAGVWLPAPPPADLHTGDVVVRLYPPADDDPATAEVEVLAAMQGEWRTVRRWRAVGARWPHEVAMSVLVHMRYLADAALGDAQWATLTGPIAASMPDWLSRGLGLAGESAGSAPRRPAPDALAALIDAGLVEVGEQLEWAGHTATVRAGGVLHDGGPHEFAVSTVTALATSLSGCTVNGWHLWHRTRDHRPLSDLRTELATR